jgi:rSAM/selenodomain-associated transferase 1
MSFDDGHSSRGDSTYPACDCGIAIMAKASLPGQAKTRLVPPLSFEEAAAFNTAFLQDIADNLMLAGRQISISPYVAFGPPGSQPFFRQILSENIELIDVWLPDFGRNLLFTMEEIFRRGHTSVVVLNSDSPTLPTSLLVETARLLEQPGERAVLGPSTDGGYYLLGLKRPYWQMFERIAWSTEHVAEQTLARAKEIDLDVHVLPVWYDVDDVEALRRLNGELAAGRSGAATLSLYPAPVTAALMSRLCRDADLIRRIGVSVPLERLGA